MPVIFGNQEGEKQVVSFRFDDDFETLTEEKKSVYLEDIARAIGVDAVDLKAFRKGSVIVDINVDKETAERLQREAQNIEDELQAELNLDGTRSSHGHHGRHFDDNNAGASRNYVYEDSFDEEEILLQSGDHFETDRGLFALAKVSGMVFHDMNANGVLDAGVEEGIEGIEVQFVRLAGDEPGEVIASVLSDRNGQYHFSEKEPGEYFVSVKLANRFLLSPMPEPGVLSEYQGRANVMRGRVVKTDFEPTRGGNSTVFALHSGSRSTELNAALYRPAKIIGYAWEDMKGEGIFQGKHVVLAQAEESDTELGTMAIADLVLQTDAEMPVTASVALRANGEYVFDAVMPGTYKLRYSLPNDFFFVRSSQAQPTFTIGSGEQREVDVGFYRPITITGSIYEDLNAVGYITGKKTEARRHIRGATVELIAQSSETRENNRYLLDHRKGISPASVTSNTGSFKFEGFAPGVYHLLFTPPDGYKRSIKLGDTELAKILSEDPEALASDADQISGKTNSYLVHSGATFKKEDGSDITVCMYTLATIGGYIWEDRNADGIFDDDERTIPNVEVQLSSYDGSLVLHTRTSERGHFLFRNLEPGRYRKPIIVPPPNHQLSNARIKSKYVDASDRRLLD